MTMFIIITRLPFNLRPTTREYVYLVTRGHFRSRDKDGGHTIWSTIVKNPMLHANIMAMCFIEQELLPIEVLHCGNWDFRPFGSCDLDLDPMTFVIWIWPVRYTECAEVNRLPTSALSKVIVRQTDGQTDKQTGLQSCTTRPPRFAGGH